MGKLFKEQQEVLDTLLTEWYEAIKAFTQKQDGIFSAKGRMYDRSSPMWEHVRFPHGFVGEIRKKLNRVDQLLDSWEDNTVSWEDVLEELGDILNYDRMLGALICMYVARMELPPTTLYELVPEDAQQTPADRVGQLAAELIALAVDGDEMDAIVNVRDRLTDVVEGSSLEKLDRLAVQFVDQTIKDRELNHQRDIALVAMKKERDRLSHLIEATEIEQQVSGALYTNEEVTDD